MLRSLGLSFMIIQKLMLSSLFSPIKNIPEQAPILHASKASLAKTSQKPVPQNLSWNLEIVKEEIIVPEEEFEEFVLIDEFPYTE